MNFVHFKSFIIMYPQFPVATNALPGYSFTQIDNSQIEVKYEFPSPTSEKDITFCFDRDTCSIYLSIKDQPHPALCGTLSHSVNNVTTVYSESEYAINIEINPNEKDPWDLLIKSPNKHGIDPKSEFLLGAEANNNEDYEKAFQYISSAAEKQYFPAMEALVDIYSTVESPYKSHYNLEDCVKILRNLFDLTEDPDAGIRLATIYKDLKMPKEEREILTRCADKSNYAKLMLADLLSPLNGSFNETDKAIQLLRELADDHMIDGISALITNLENGYGTPLDDNEIKRLKNEIVNYQRKQITEKYKNVFIGCAVAVATCAAIIGITLYRKKRSHK